MFSIVGFIYMEREDLVLSFMNDPIQKNSMNTGNIFNSITVVSTFSTMTNDVQKYIYSGHEKFRIIFKKPSFGCDISPANMKKAKEKNSAPSLIKIYLQ